ncbi:hypothetical protein RHGRI_006604 [Rhododendron griersonianum]|uniref:Carboxypeptidase n=1 Tax=Rhododendron griersonianum TaxID=479676 RepID=A0AAV6KUW8_9ERIC|nr:hypothetical protein RHGRI_006604 [Rhododendron griersonianum]
MLAQAWLIRAAAIFCGIQIVCLITVESLSESDRIQILPGQPQVSFQQFGGYITVDEKQYRALFYYFVEAETDPASKPLVLWLNGARDNLVFLENWFNKFPEYKNTDFFITGESYGGNPISVMNGPTQDTMFHNLHNSLSNPKSSSISRE